MKLSEIDATLREIRVSPVKTLGQNFLHDRNLARWIVDKSELSPADYVVARDSPLEDGWRNAEVKEALDLCLSCKGCLHECPVRVDMATYKAEFLSHYYQRRLRPRQAYLLGLIRWASLFRR